MEDHGGETGQVRSGATAGLRKSPSPLPLHNLPQPPPVHIPERHRPVIALQHDGIRGRLGDVHGGAGGAVHLYISLDGKAIENHADEYRVLRFFTGRIEARRETPAMVRWPRARPSAG